MAVLVIAEHDNKQLKPGVDNTVAAAAKMGGEVVVLIAGHECAAAAQPAAKIEGVKKVLLADAPQYATRISWRRRQASAGISCRAWRGS
jgi:electron transfer flavoprotein alpha subunit